MLGDIGERQLWWQFHAAKLGSAMKLFEPQIQLLKVREASEDMMTASLHTRTIRGQKPDLDSVKDDWLVTTELGERP